jgi:hypothetical protein
MTINFLIVIITIIFQRTKTDVPPENDTRYNVVKGGINGQERVHTGTNYQQATRG